MCASKADGGKRCDKKHYKPSNISINLSDNSVVKSLKKDPETEWHQDKNKNDIIIPSEKNIDEIIEFINKNKTTFLSYNKNLKEFFEKNYPGEKLPWGTQSLKFYGAMLLSTFAPVSFSKETLNRIFKEAFNRASGDIIQSINKTGQEGLEKQTFKQSNITYYHLAVLEKSNYKRIAYSVDDDHKQRLEKVINHRRKRLENAEKALKEGAIDVGHRNPYGSDPSSSNLIAQVSSENRAYRDKYIFDENGDIAAPSPHTLINNVEKYYNDEALNEILLGLLKKKGDFLNEKTMTELKKHLDG